MPIITNKSDDPCTIEFGFKLYINEKFGNTVKQEVFKEIMEKINKIQLTISHFEGTEQVSIDSAFLFISNQQNIYL